jgi:hypothetical protein
MQSTENLIGRFVTYIIDPAILLIFSAGFLVFMWGMVQFLINVDNATKREEGKQHMIWGVIGMLIMISVYGILALLDNTFQLGALNGNIDTSRIDNVTAPINFGGQ